MHAQQSRQLCTIYIHPGLRRPFKTVVISRGQMPEWTESKLTLQTHCFCCCPHSGGQAGVSQDGSSPRLGSPQPMDCRILHRLELGLHRTASEVSSWQVRFSSLLALSKRLCSAASK